MYLVYVAGRRAPVRVHSTREEAKSEADRLARMPENTGRSVFVLAAIYELRPVVLYNWFPVCQK